MDVKKNWRVPRTQLGAAILLGLTKKKLKLQRWVETTDSTDEHGFSQLKSFIYKIASPAAAATIVGGSYISEICVIRGFFPK